MSQHRDTNKNQKAGLVKTVTEAAKQYVESERQLREKRSEFHVALRNAWKLHKATNLREIAEVMGCSIPFVSDALLGRRNISAELASRFIEMEDEDVE